VPKETQFLLAETEQGDCILLIPLVGKDFRFSLAGHSEGLALIAETNDVYKTVKSDVGLFVAVGKDPYELMESSARAVMARLRTGRLRREKPLPDFVDDFGWCTWDAFYQEVTAQNVADGLKTFAEGGVEPRFLILDDGWQSTAEKPTGEHRLTSLSPNKKFGGSLRPLVSMAKTEFKIRTFLVWHAFIGYWGGVDGAKLKRYGVRDVLRSFGPGVLTHDPDSNNHWWGALIGLVPEKEIGQFYDDYHRLLREQGVDGVKVDNQGSLEGVANGSGGRVRLTRAYRKALEASVQKHFSGRLMNCMSNANETHLMCRDSSLLRTSTDFWPNRPHSHGLHLYTNAQVGLWFGQFIHPDWDMFQSGHAAGPYHAAGRAVSGSPVYVSDKPGKQNFELLKKLVTSDGKTLRCDDIGLPTRDCLFANVTRDAVLLKIFNSNGEGALIGVFNANYHAEKREQTRLEGSVSPADSPRLKGRDFAVYSHQGGKLSRSALDGKTPVSLREGEWELFTIVPIERGFAAIGLSDKLNSAGAIKQRGWLKPKKYEVTLKDGGQFIAWSEKEPVQCEADGKPVAFRYDAASNALRVRLKNPGEQVVTFTF
jgi:raffinose synthase